MTSTLLIRIWLTVVVVGILVFASTTSAEVVIDWVTVGDPGNFPDFLPMTCCGDSTGSSGYGTVTDEYRIGKYEVTNAQYAEFLNAVAETDANFLYNFNMSSGFFKGGIAFSGSPGSFTYTAIVGRENMPVNWVSFWDSIRFANWLHNGQPTGAQDNTTTEDGAYTITAQGIADNSIARNVGATVFVPNEGEWYKAAYYDDGPPIYYIYPAGSSSQTSCTAAGATANTANCNSVVNDLTDVGSYTGSSSPSGTFDQGGNALEWSETSTGEQRVSRGGSYLLGPNSFAASHRVDSFPEIESDHFGFRVASTIPAPAVPSLSPLAMAMLLSLLGLAGYRRLRA